MSSGDSTVFQPLAADDPEAVGSYRLAARLGAGGMGKVYLSYTPAGRPVAVKVIRPELAEDPDFRRRFAQEVQSAQRVQGLYTAPVIDSDANGSPPWLATAYVQGPTLSSAVVQHGALPVETVLLLVAGIAEALQAVHAAGLVHRDLKPSNVLLAADGPRVIDFGIARAADATALTDSGVTVGTPAFMAPEQAAMREITPATDVFALGQVAAYAALGAPAYGEGPSHAVLYRIVHEEPELSALPEQLRALVARCLEKDPARRPSTAEVVTLCQAASEGTQLRRPDQWLPGALAAEIPRHALPGYTPTQSAGTPPPGVTRPDGEAPGPYQPTQTAPTPPPTAPPSTGPHQPTQAAGSSTAYQATQAAGTPPPGGPVPPPTPPPGAGYGPGTGAYPPVQQPSYPQHGGPAGYGYPQQQHPMAMHGAPGPHGGVPRPLPLPPKKSKAVYIVPAVIAVFVLAVVVPLVVKAGGGGKDDNAGKSGGSSSAPSQHSTGSGSETRTHTPPAPKPEQHPGVQLANEYHLVLADADFKPAKGLDDDLYYFCTDMIDPGCHFGTNSQRLVLLDSDETGSLDTCLKDTRYTTQVDTARLSPGSQICASTDSAVALITYKRSSKSSEASTYVVADVTVWRNAIPPTSN
ncbi:serine/threonine-protein kinase [Streptomyces sp. NPDC020917]|uniref:serine/threonine-protein kinase n=1 Tax=Streptomyces sp. NPDC020917 TaxID=3365102 RepID=UPI0037A31F41